MQVFKCDRCGNECDPVDVVERKVATEEPFYLIVSVEHPGEATARAYPDLCNECFWALTAIKEPA
ncbi:hypothetical protein LCGC14_0948640 [marine sediment metagenome]|uniref:Uncharacterized protein n=1 Tax=marine sediment metagenome TaxID=412755 RepID=A0A0F9R1E7_9ZZZZ